MQEKGGGVSFIASLIETCFPIFSLKLVGTEVETNFSRKIYFFISIFPAVLMLNIAAHSNLRTAVSLMEHGEFVESNKHVFVRNLFIFHFYFSCY